MLQSCCLATLEKRTLTRQYIYIYIHWGHMYVEGQTIKMYTNVGPYTVCVFTGSYFMWKALMILEYNSYTVGVCVYVCM